MVEAVAELLRKMESGELSGLMFIASTPHGDDITGVYGAYADRLQYAVYAATKGLNTLVDAVAESPGVGSTASGPLEGSHRTMQGIASQIGLSLPRRLGNY